VVSDAVIAAQHRGGDQPEQFLGFGAERAGFVGLVVESEETLDAEVAAAEDFFVEARCEILENLPGDRMVPPGGQLSRRLKTVRYSRIRAS